MHYGILVAFFVKGIFLSGHKDELVMLDSPWIPDGRDDELMIFDSV